MQIVWKRECGTFKNKVEENGVMVYRQHLSGSGQAPVENAHKPH